MEVFFYINKPYNPLWKALVSLGKEGCINYYNLCS